MIAATTTQAIACNAAVGVAAYLTCQTGIDSLALTCAGTGAWLSAMAMRDVPMWRWMLMFLGAAWLSAVFGTFGAHALGVSAMPGATGAVAGVVGLFFHAALGALSEGMRPMLATLWAAIVDRVRGRPAPPGSGGGAP